MNLRHGIHCDADHYEETGSGFPLLLIPGGGLNSTIAALANPFDALQEFKVMTSNYAADLGQSSGGMITMATIAKNGPSRTSRRCSMPSGSS